MAGLTNSDLTSADGLSVSDDGSYTVHGEGTFDDLMEAVNKHVDSQFKLGRLQGGDYAKVYVESLKAAMSGAVSFLVQRVDPDLLAAQILKVEAEVRLADAQKLKVDADILLSGAQKLLTDAQTGLIAKQGQKIDAEVGLLNEKKVTEQHQQDVLDAQVAMLGEQAKGFQWSANQKYMKSIIDGQAVNANIEGVGMVGHPFNQSNLTAVADAAKPY